jgi:hypothetical protein
MKPILGIAVELVILAVFVALIRLLQTGLFLWLFVIIVELVSTYLVHCPAHYLVGSLLGIKFRDMSIGRSTLAKALPQNLSRVSRLIPILTLSTVKSSASQVSGRRRAWMYASGTIASCASTLIFATVASLLAPIPYALLAWIIALGYLAFDVVFSPKSGDLMRARLALRA